MNDAMMFGVRNKTLLNNIVRFKYDSKQETAVLRRQMDAIKSSIVFFST